MNHDKRILYGEIWLVRFDPSVGHEFQKERPAIVIQSNVQIRKSNLLSVVPLTSNNSKVLPDDILIKKTTQNHLLTDSVVKVYSIVSYDYSRFINKIGFADLKILNEIKQYLRKHFDLLK